MVIFNEKKYARDMCNNSEKKIYSLQEMTVFCKWLRWSIFNRKSSEENDELTKTSLINFCHECWEDFDADVDYIRINKALTNSKKEKLRSCKPIFISKNEWDVIDNINNENAKKVLFVMLVVAKFNRVNPIKLTENTQEREYPDKRLRCNLGFEDIYLLAKIRLKNDEHKFEVWQYYNDDIIELVDGQKLRRILNFADLNVTKEDAYIIVDNYDDIILYYEQQYDSSIKKCSLCGALFKDKTKIQNLSYCPKCKANEEKKKVENFICKECGKRFELRGDALKGNGHDYCKECYKKMKIKTAEIKCTECGKMFRLQGNELKGSRTRCDECREKQEQVIKTVICEDCGKTFILQGNAIKGGRTRCDECREKSKIKTITCEDCGKTFELTGKSKRGPQTRCRECYKKYKRESHRQVVQNSRNKGKKEVL